MKRKDYKIKLTVYVSEDLIYKCALRAMKENKELNKEALVTEAMERYLGEEVE